MFGACLQFLQRRLLKHMRLVTAGVGLASLMILATFLPGHSQELGVFIVQPSTAILRFEELGHTCGGPNRSWGTGYITYNGTHLSISSATFQSSLAANQELHKWLQGATQIQEWGPKYNHLSEVTGERIVAIYVVEDKNKVAILWRQQESIFFIETESLECALEFERRLPAQD